MDSLFQDLSYAVRGFLRTPRFTLVAVLTLALGIGATSSIFSVVNAIILRPLPFPNSDRLVRLYATEPDDTRDLASGADFVDWRESNESFQFLAAYNTMTFTLAEGEWPVNLGGASVSSDFFVLVGVPALLGQPLIAEVSDGGLRTVVLSHALWQSRFGADPAIVGREVRISDEGFLVVAVMPPGFDYPDGTQLWASPRYRVPDPPVDTGIDPAEDRGAEYLDVIGRLKSGISLREAQAEMDVIAERIATTYTETNADEGIRLVPLHESIVGSVRSLLLVLFGAVGFVLLIACANVANLLLVRASGRERELAVRIAMGAGRGRVVRQLLTESVLLGLVGGMAGLLLAGWGTSAVLALAPERIPRAEAVRVDLAVMVWTFSVAFVTGVVFGLVPAFRVFGRNLQSAMQIGGGRQTSGPQRSRLRDGLVVGEVALSLLLLVGAGLMVRTFHALNRVDPGFDPGNTLRAHIWVPEKRYPEGAQRAAFYRETLERVRSIPGVRSAAVVLSLPIGTAISGTFHFRIDGRPVAPQDEPAGGYQLASADYFGTLGIPLLRGRLLTEADDEDAPSVAVISQALADLYWPSEDPIGQRVTWDDPDEDVDWVTIVGVVGNTHHRGLDKEERAEIYRPYSQAPLPFMTLVVRSDGDAAALSEAVRRAVVEVDPEQPVFGLATMDQVLAESIGRQRFGMLVLGLFAASAMALAAIGLYGVLSYSVSQRANEIGIRMALGAGPERMIAQVVGNGLRLGAIGLAIGVVAAFGLTRLMSSLIFGVRPADPLAFALAIALLISVTLLASYVPARRAAGVDPNVVLRQE